MYWYGDPMTGWGYALMVISTLTFWALIIGGAVVLVRYLGREAHATPASPPAPTPEQILAERFARG